MSEDGVMCANDLESQHSVVERSRRRRQQERSSAECCNSWSLAFTKPCGEKSPKVTLPTDIQGSVDEAHDGKDKGSCCKGTRYN